MLNWLFSSFTYLPNFIIWLPSFSSPWFVRLGSKRHLVIFPFVRFLDFFHSVKKVSKPIIFREIICVSKRTLAILIVVLHSFLQVKKIVFLFFLSFVWFISGEGISLGAVFLEGDFARGQFSWAQISGGGGCNFDRGGAFIGGDFLGGNLGGNFPDTASAGVL